MNQEATGPFPQSNDWAGFRLGHPIGPDWSLSGSKPVPFASF